MGAVLGHLGVQRDGLLADSRPSVSFGELYEYHYPHVLRFVAHRVSDSDLAEDITQEAFARAFTKFDELRNGARFSSWVRTIARRLVIEHYETKSRVVPVAHLDPGHAAAADEGLLQSTEEQDVRGAYGRVGTRYQEVLWLREQQGLSYDEIAARLGATATTVPPLLFRARAALRREYFALTEHERIAGIAPVWLGAADLARRARARVVQFANWFPDAQAFGGSVTAVALSVGSLLGLTDYTGIARPAFWESAPASAVNGSSRTNSSTAARETRAAPSPAHAASDMDRRDIGDTAGLDTLTLGKRDTTFDHERARQRRDEDRHMPYYVEFGDHSVGVDPGEARRDLESSMAGDLSWTEGACEDPDLAC